MKQKQEKHRSKENVDIFGFYICSIGATFQETDILKYSDKMS